MKSGSKGCRVDEEVFPERLKSEVAMEARLVEVEATMSMIRESLSSSSGQMSGQCVKPKYTCNAII